jgi:hypothetical protein
MLTVIKWVLLLLCSVLGMVILATDPTQQSLGLILAFGCMYLRDHKEAFENAKLKGLNNPNEYMYMYSKDNKDYFKNINYRNYINFNQ